MLVATWMGSNIADGNQQKHLLPSFGTKACLEIHAYSITKPRTLLKQKFV